MRRDNAEELNREMLISYLVLLAEYRRTVVDFRLPYMDSTEICDEI